MKGLNNYLKYNRIIFRLSRQLKREEETQQFLNEIGLVYETFILSNIKKRIEKVDRIWLSKNLIK